MATTASAAAARPSHFKTRGSKVCIAVRAYNKAPGIGLEGRLRASSGLLLREAEQRKVLMDLSPAEREATSGGVRPSAKMAERRSEGEEGGQAFRTQSRPELRQMGARIITGRPGTCGKIGHPRHRRLPRQPCCAMNRCSSGRHRRCWTDNPIRSAPREHRAPPTPPDWRDRKSTR